METLVKYQAEIKMMVELSSLINSSLDIQNVLDNALFCIEQFIDAEVSSIFEVDHEKGELFFLLTRGHDSERIKKYRLKIGEGIAGWVAKTEKPLICSNPANDPHFCHRFDEQSGYCTSNIICVPIKNKDQIIGVIELLNKKSSNGFDENDLEILTILGNQIGIALENARIYCHVKKKLSTTEKELGIIGEKLLRAERLAVLGKFSQGVAHEVRNPVMVIGGFARRLQKHMPSGDPAYGILAMILTSTEKLETMVRAIEEFTLLPEPVLKPANLPELLDQILNGHAPTLMQRAIQVRKRVLEELPPIHTDSQLIGHALQHLIINAQEAMSEGGVLDVVLSLDSSRVQITLVDTGCGISLEDMPYIFDPFFSTKPNNLGMGLTTAQRIISDHKGEIQINSIAGTGTEVKVLLPLGLDP